jgi:hypothetical protein
MHTMNLNLQLDKWFTPQFVLGTKWAGTIMYLIGMSLTAFNIYPINIIASTLGAILWTVAAVVNKDKALLLLEITTIAIYVIGIINFILK